MTEVIFRKFKDGDIIALFPYDIQSRDGLIGSYMHVGQHSAATLNLIRETKLATAQEYNALKHELMSLGYKVKVISRVNNRKYFDEWKTSMTECEQLSQ